MSGDQSADQTMLSASVRLGVALVTVAVIFAGGLLPVLAAGPSPAIAPSKVTVDEPMGQGEEIRLPSFTVSNLGDESGTFVMDLFHFAGQREKRSDPSWFQIDPLSFTLEPAATQTVNVRMRIPRDAAAGDYRSFLRATAQPTADPAAGRATVSPAVAVTLVFTVENRNFHFYDPLVDFFSDRAPFSYIGLGLLVLAVAIELLRRRFRLRISLGVERRE
jgi:hypothetical protein